MRESLFILAVIVVIFVLTAVRYRRQINGAIRVWRMFKALRQQTGKDVRKNLNRGQQTRPLSLVNCAGCGSWIPEADAVRLGRTSYFCSGRCLEETAGTR